MKITVETTVKAPLALVWESWSDPAAIVLWNAASDDWHTTSARVDLRAGGQFSSRMEAKDGSFGFDFAGEYTLVEPMRRIETRFGERTAQVEFVDGPDGVVIRQSFDPENQNPAEMQAKGWQAILDNFARYVASKVSNTP
jgi:uncharacterized protein YndB with AHSA1/START domain